MRANFPQQSVGQNADNFPIYLEMQRKSQKLAKRSQRKFKSKRTERRVLKGCDNFKLLLYFFVLILFGLILDDFTTCWLHGGSVLASFLSARLKETEGWSKSENLKPWWSPK